MWFWCHDVLRGVGVVICYVVLVTHDVLRGVGDTICYVVLVVFFWLPFFCVLRRLYSCVGGVLCFVVVLVT